MGKSIVLPRANTIREDIGNMGITADNKQTSWFSTDYIERISNGNFDAVVYGERQTYHWMAGSGHFHHTLDPTSGYKQTETHAKVQIAITYTNVNGNTRVRLYRDGIKFGDYTKGRIQIYSRGDTEIFWGIRHGSASGGPGHLDALIEESRIYAGVLTPEELKQLKPLCY